MSESERRRVHRDSAMPPRTAARAEAGADEPRKLNLGELAVAVPSLPLAMGLLAAALIIAGLYFGRDILIPLALAVLLGFVLDPLVVGLRRRGLPHIVAVIAVVGLVLGGVAVPAYLLPARCAG